MNRANPPPHPSPRGPATTAPAPDTTDEPELFGRRHDPDARAELVARYDGLAHRLALRFRGRGIATDDLVQVARYGLLNAIDRFDPERGVRFGTFAGRTIIGEIKHHFRNHSWSIRVPRALQNLWLRISSAIEVLSQTLGRKPSIDEIAVRLDVEPDDVLEALDAGSGYTAASLDRPVGDGATPLVSRLGDIDARVRRAPEWGSLAEEIQDLPERERVILFLRFFEGKTQEEIGEIVGVSQVHVSRLLRGTIDELRTRLSAAE